jgi:hypothetical protein
MEDRDKVKFDVCMVRPTDFRYWGFGARGKEYGAQVKVEFMYGKVPNKGTPSRTHRISMDFGRLIGARHYIDGKVIEHGNSGYRFVSVGVDQMLAEVARAVEERLFADWPSACSASDAIKRRLADLITDGEAGKGDASAYVVFGLVQRAAFERQAPPDSSRPKRMITL